jgi:hypothetical protein
MAHNQTFLLQLIFKNVKEELIKIYVVMSQKIIILINAKVKMTVPQEDHAIIKNVKEI